MALRQAANPNAKLTAIFGALTVTGLAAGIVGLSMESDMGIGIGILGLVVGVTGLITVPILWFSGRKQVAEMKALFRGEGLLVHWSFDRDEWERYTQNEYARGVKQTRTVAIWTFVLTFAISFLAEFFSDTVTTATLGLAVAIALTLTAFLGGTGYLVTMAAHRRNRAGIGEVFIGETCLLFGKKFFSWSGAWANLEKVSFDEGDPSVVQFNIEYGTGDARSDVEVRIPVPRGREQEAQALVDSYYAAS